MNKLLEVYSKGFFNTLKEEEIEAATTTAQTLLEIYSQEDLHNFFKNKTITKEEKLKLALDLAGESSLKGLVSTLSENNRFELVPAIFKHFIDYASKRQNKIPAIVTTNKEPNEEIKICIGRDPREHGRTLADSFSRGAGGVKGVKVVYTNIATTPALFDFCRYE